MSEDRGFEVAREEVKEHDKPLDIELHEDRTKEFKSTAFSRMRTDWDGPERDTVQHVQGIIDGQLYKSFPGVYETLNDLYDIIREPVVDEKTGEVKRDFYGYPEWKRTKYGAYDEDYSRLTMKQKENFLHRITNSMVEWEQIAADLWGEALWAKAFYEETFALGFSQSNGTVDARTQAGRLAAREERYMGICKSILSRKADALTRSMERIGQRLKDTYD